jgi:hypothetical protein
MTNSKYKIVVMLNMLERLLRELRSRHDADWTTAFGRTFAEHAPSILAACAASDRRYASARLQAMLEEAGLLDTPLQEHVTARQAPPMEQSRAA